MQTAEGIRRRIETTEDLHSIVRTMKAFATVSIRQYEEAVVSLVDYAHAVNLGMRALLLLRPDALSEFPTTSSAPSAAVVFGSDQGLCGAFNEQIVARYIEKSSPVTGGAAGPVLAVGTRVATRLEDRGVSLTEVMTLPASAAMIVRLVGEILEQIDAWRVSGDQGGVHLYFNQPDPTTIYRAHDEQLLPIPIDHLRAIAGKPWRPRGRPMLSTDWDVLFSEAFREYLFVTIHRAVAESMASEHAARRAAMHAAERNIEDRLSALRSEFNKHRQSVITTELLDIVSGYEVLRDDDRRGPPPTPQSASSP